MKENLTLGNLLNQVLEITRKYDEMAILSGENFNIFRILKLTSAEVRLHSAFLAELFNPEGRHGLQDTFLKLFIQKIFQNDDTRQIDAFQTNRATVKVEKWLGRIIEEDNSGGFIDILIQFPNQQTIIIENKINAGNQYSQLRRYHNSNKKALLVYLTLWGTEANNITTLNEGNPEEKIEPICISYRDHIKDWLEECKKATIDYPIIRETITQYIFLIKELTHQTPNNHMKNELVETIIAKPEFIKAAEEVSNAWYACQLQIIQNLKPSIHKIGKELDLIPEIDENLGERDSKFYFYRDDLQFSIWFYFESSVGMLVGIDRNPKTDISEDINLKLKKHFVDFPFKDKLNYPNWIWVAKFSAWEETPWEEINTKIPEEISKALVILIEKIEEFKP